jgi:hypothetical protein
MNYSNKTIKELIAICKEKSIKGYSGKNKDKIIKLINASKNKTIPIPKNLNKNNTNIEIDNIPIWYKIPEISPSDFIKCCKGVFSVVEGKHESKSTEDPFLKAVMNGYYNMTETEWHNSEKVRLKQKVLEMKMGDFHEELIGKFPEYETLPCGHTTGCDVQKKDGSIIFEVKNRDNTVKGSDGKHIITLLEKHKKEGKKVIFAQINCSGGKVNRYGASSDIDIWNGQQVYTFLSGRDTFFDDLLLTIQYVFSTYKTLIELKAALEIA